MRCQALYLMNVPTTFYCLLRCCTCDNALTARIIKSEERSTQACLRMNRSAPDTGPQVSDIASAERGGRYLAAATYRCVLFNQVVISNI
jgi:hypothetical protein